MVSPAKYGRLGPFYFWEVGTSRHFWCFWHFQSDRSLFRCVARPCRGRKASEGMVLDHLLQTIQIGEVDETSGQPHGTRACGWVGQGLIDGLQSNRSNA